MLPLFNLSLATLLALGWLLIGMTLPFLALWFCIRIARDLRRIANALDFAGRDARPSNPRPRADLTPQEEKNVRSIANSAFGR
jgi:hypothetical protein